MLLIWPGLVCLMDLGYCRSSTRLFTGSSDFAKRNRDLNFLLHGMKNRYFGSSWSISDYPVYWCQKDNDYGIENTVGLLKILVEFFRSRKKKCLCRIFRHRCKVKFPHTLPVLWVHFQLMVPELHIPKWAEPLNNKLIVAQLAVSKGWERLGKGLFFGIKLFPVSISAVQGVGM